MRMLVTIPVDIPASSASLRRLEVFLAFVKVLHLLRTTSSVTLSTPEETINMIKDWQEKARESKRNKRKQDKAREGEEGKRKQEKAREGERRRGRQEKAGEGERRPNKTMDSKIRQGK